MTRLAWSGLPAKYEVGVDRGVLYLPSGGVAWSGLVDVTDDTPTEVIADVYVDGQRQMTAVGKSDFQGTLEAYTYPSEFEPYIGYLDGLTAQPQVDPFGLSYRTTLEDGHRIHLVYNLTAEMLGWNTQTLSNVTEPSTFKWKLNTTPEMAEGLAPTAHVYVNTSEAHAHVVTLFEEMIYGTASTDPTLPSLEEVRTFFDENALFIVIDHGDGTWTATGPDDMIQMLDATSFQITSPSAIVVDVDTYTLSNY